MRFTLIDDLDTDMTRFFSILILLTFALTLVTPATAQDPFATPLVKSGAQPAENDAPKDKSGRRLLDDFSESSRTIVASVRGAVLDTPYKLTEAVRTMMDIEEYDEAKFYLKQLTDQNLSASTLFTLNREIGSDFFFRLARSSEMAPEGQTFADQVIRTSYVEAFSPARISGLIDGLSADSGTRSKSFQELRSLGETGVAEMLNVFADPANEKKFDDVRSVLHLTDYTVMEPLVAGSQSANESVRFESVLALSKIRDVDAFDAITGAFYSQDSSTRIKNAASSAFMAQYGYFPGPEKVTRVWLKRAQDYLDDADEIGARRLGINSVTEPVWRWDPASNRLVKFELDRIAASRVKSATLGELVATVNPERADLQEFHMLTYLESRKQLLGSFKSIDIEAFRRKFATTDAGQVSGVLADALKKNLIPAAIGCCEVLSEMGDESILYSASHRPAPLVNAILYGDRHLQYAALKAIGNLAPKTNFPGSSYVTQTAVYMADFAEKPAVLVGNAREDLARTLATRLSPSGFQGITANNGGEFFRAASSNANLQFLMICDSFNRPDYAELTQQLRQDWRTKQLPIVILYRSENSNRAQRIARDDEMTVAMPFTTNTELVGLQVEHMKRFSAVWPVTIDHRRFHSEFAISWLNKVATSPGLSRVFDITNYEARLSKLLFTPGWEYEAAQIMAKLGTADSQRTLVSYASELGIAIDARGSAAAAFKVSVKENGLLLTSKEIIEQYNRYNASRTESKESQRVLGDILDSIESETKK